MRAFSSRLTGLLLALTVCLTPVMMAQTSSTGALAVTVTDPSGAVVTGANLVLTSAATGQTRSEKTGSQGTYSFQLLPVGSYSVEINAPGFKPVQILSVVINVTETRALTQVLEVGDSAQSVTVDIEAQALQTETAALGAVVGTTTINALPLVSRNYTQILSMSAGAVSNVVNAATVGHGSPTIFVNGFLGNGNSYMQDGADITQLNSGTTEGNFGSIPIPNPDALQEFKVQTSMFDAGYGRNAGGNVNVVTKSGTNQFHGSVFEYLRNEAFNANDFFSNRSGLPRQVLKQNQYGFTLGGPFWKNKLFFFISYQKTKQVNGVDTTAKSSVILPPQLTNDRSRAGLGNAFCPQNNPAGSVYANTRFGGVQVACDGSNINPVALALLNYQPPGVGSFLIPTPQAVLNPGTAAAFGSSVFSIPATYSEPQYLGNLDYLLSSKHTLSFRYFYARSVNIRPFGASPHLPGVSAGNWSNGNNNGILKLTSTLNASMVNEARVSSTYVRASDYSLDPMRSPDFGLKPAVATFPLMPVITLTGLFGFGGTTNNGQFENSHTTQYSDQLSWTRGHHSVRTGFQGERYYWFARVYAIARGALTFNTFPDFLLGLSAAQNGTAFSNVNSTNYQAGSPNLHMVSDTYNAFVQDDYKVHPRLTLNLGLRWEYDGQLWDRGGFTFDHWWERYQAVPIPPAGGTYEGLTMGANYPGTLPDGIYRRPGNTSLRNGSSPKHDFMPRIGLAWTPLKNNNKLVIRAGYAWFFSRITFNSPQFAACCGPPESLTKSLSGASNAGSTFQVPFQPEPPVDKNVPTNANSARQSGGPVGFTPYLRTLTSNVSFPAGIDPDQIPPLVTNYNLNIQYALKPSMVLEAGYVNSRGLRLAQIQQFNIPQIASPANPINCALPSGCITTNTAANATQRVPVIGLTPGGARAEGNYGDSQYHGLQVELRQRLSHGLQFGLAYTFSRVMNIDLTSGNPLFDRRTKWGRASQDRTQRLIANFTYQLPAYRAGKGVNGKLLSGWAISGVATAQTGSPLTFTDNAAGAVYAFIGGSRAQLCPGVTYADINTPGDVKSRLNNSYNKNAFCSAPIVGAVNGIGGATGNGNTGRSIVEGPGQFNWDGAITKMTSVKGFREDAKLEFRAEFFNAFNHAQFNNPGTAVGVAGFGVVNTTSVAPRIMQFALKYIF